MSSHPSRRAFLTYAPGAAFVVLTAFGKAFAFASPLQNPTTNQGNTGQPSSTHPSLGGGAYGGGGMHQGPGPAQHNGETASQTVTRPDDKKKDPAPRKPRKNLEADQKSLRDEVRQLVQDSHELKNAVEQAGLKEPMSAEMVSKTKEIEKLAHDIATLAKG
jgi:hypothetical protein